MTTASLQKTLFSPEGSVDNRNSFLTKTAEGRSTLQMKILDFATSTDAHAISQITLMLEAFMSLHGMHCSGILIACSMKKAKGVGCHGMLIVLSTS